MRTSLLAFACTLGSVPAFAQWSFDWAVQTTSEGVENATSCAVSPDGHVALTGRFNSQLIVGDLTADGAPGNGSRGFVAYYDAMGAFEWAHVVSAVHESGANCQLWDVAIDDDGNVIVAGQFNDSLLLDGVKVLDSPSEPNTRAFDALKFNSAGELQWAAAVAVEGATGFLHAVAADHAGDIYLTGQGGNQYGHLVKLSGATGNTLFHLIPDGAGALIADVTVDAANNVYVTGLANNAFTMGGMTCPYNDALGGGSTPLFVGKLNSVGNAQWYYVPDQTGSGYYGFPEGNIAVTDDGICFVETRKRIRINDVIMNDGNGSTHALFSLDALGAVRWARPVNLTGQLAINDIRCESSGDVLLVGQSYGPTVDLVDTLINPTIFDHDIFLARYANSDGALDELLLSGPSMTEAMAVGLDADDVPTICGTFSGTLQLGDQELTGSWNAFVTRLGSTTGINDANHDASLLLAPNPTNGLFTLQLPQAKTWDITVLDILGRPVQRLRSATSVLTLDAAAWAKGTYKVLAESEGLSSQRTLVVE